MEDFENDKEEIVGFLVAAKENIEMAVDNLERAKRIMRDLPYGYSVAGNMEGYVINYLSGGMDSIIDKIETYIEETEDLKEEDEENEEE